MPSFSSIAPAFLERTIACLLPLFLRGAGEDAAAARHAVLSTLAAYAVEDEQELRLAAGIISFGFAALEALAKAMNPELSLNVVLRLRGNANAAHRSAHQCQRTLDRLRKDRRIAAGTATVRAQPPEIPSQAADAADHNSVRQVDPPAPAPRMDLSRQQRRELERKAAKAQRRMAGRAADRVRSDAKATQRAAFLPFAPSRQSHAAGIGQAAAL